MAFLYGLTPSTLGQIAPFMQQQNGQPVEPYQIDYGQVPQQAAPAAIAFEPQVVAGMVPEESAPAFVPAAQMAAPLPISYGAPPVLPVDAAAIATRPAIDMSMQAPQVDFARVVPPPTFEAPAAAMSQAERIATRARAIEDGDMSDKPLPAVPAIFAGSSVLAPYLAMYAQGLQEETGEGTTTPATPATAEPVPATEEPVPATAEPVAVPATGEPVPAESEVPAGIVPAGVETQPPATAEGTTVPPAAPVAAQAEEQPVTGELKAGGVSAFKMPMTVGGQQADYDFEFVPAKDGKPAQLRQKKPGTDQFVTITEGKFRNKTAEDIFARAKKAHEIITSQENIYIPPIPGDPQSRPKIKIGDAWSELYIDPETGSTSVVDESGFESPLDITTLPGFERDTRLQQLHKQAKTSGRLGALRQSFSGGEGGTFTYDPVVVFADRDKPLVEKPVELPSLSAISEAGIINPHYSQYITNIKPVINYGDNGVPIFGFEFKEPDPGTVAVPDAMQARLNAAATAHNKIIADEAAAIAKGASPEIDTAIDKLSEEYKKNLATLESERIQQEAVVAGITNKKSAEYKQEAAKLKQIKSAYDEAQKEYFKFLANPAALSQRGASGAEIDVTLVAGESQKLSNITNTWPDISISLTAPLTGDPALQQVNVEQGQVIPPEEWWKRVIRDNVLADEQNERSQGEQRAALVSPDLMQASKMLDQMATAVQQEATKQLGENAYQVLNMPINGNKKQTLNKVFEGVSTVSKKYVDISRSGRLNSTALADLNEEYSKAIAPLRAQNLSIAGEVNGSPFAITLDNSEVAQSLPRQFAQPFLDPLSSIAKFGIGRKFFTILENQKPPETNVSRPPGGTKDEPDKLPVRILLGNPVTGVKGSTAAGNLLNLLSAISNNNPIELTQAMQAYLHSPSSGFQTLLVDTTLTHGREAATSRQANKAAVETVAHVNKLLSNKDDQEAKNIRADLFKTYSKMYEDKTGLGFFAKGSDQQFAVDAEKLVQGSMTAAQFTAKWGNPGMIDDWLKTDSAKEMLATLVGPPASGGQGLSRPQAQAALKDLGMQMVSNIDDFARSMASIGNGIDSQDPFGSFTTKRKGQFARKLAFLTVPADAATAAGYGGQTPPSSIFQLPVLLGPTGRVDLTKFSGTQTSQNVTFANSSDLVVNKPVLASLAGSGIHDEMVKGILGSTGINKVEKLFADLQKNVYSDLTGYRKPIVGAEADKNVRYVPGVTEKEGLAAFLKNNIIMNTTDYGQGGLHTRKIPY